MVRQSINQYSHISGMTKRRPTRYNNANYTDHRNCTARRFSTQYVYKHYLKVPTTSLVQTCTHLSQVCYAFFDLFSSVAYTYSSILRDQLLKSIAGDRAFYSYKLSFPARQPGLTAQMQQTEHTKLSHQKNTSKSFSRQLQRASTADCDTKKDLYNKFQATTARQGRQWVGHKDGSAEEKKENDAAADAASWGLGSCLSGALLRATYHATDRH